jgi:hypothetical protein
LERRRKWGWDPNFSIPPCLGEVSRGVVGAFPNKSEQLILHCCSF